MANICPKSDGGGLVYNISYDDIQSIFKTYPEVKVKYLQNVPQRMSETDFWTKFFQSYYFRRDQISASAGDIFAECSIKDDQELRKKAFKALEDPLVSFDVNKELTKEDGYGLTDFIGNKSTLANQNLIKRYNYYSMRVLSSMEENAQGGKKETAKANETVPKKKIRLNEEIEDLKEDEANKKQVALNLTHIDRYFYAPKVHENKINKIENILKNQDIKVLCEKTLDMLNNWNLNVSKISNTSLAIGILVELSPGSKLMQSNGIRNLKDEIPKVNQDEIKTIYLCCCEMLKNFHRAFPTKNTEQELRVFFLYF
jgi:transcription initiation factor TFIIH subunit 1